MRRRRCGQRRVSGSSVASAWRSVVKRRMLLSRAETASRRRSCSACMATACSRSCSSAASSRRCTPS
eukprot:3935271-Alexandrium_andersonii.AAC.1